MKKTKIKLIQIGLVLAFLVVGLSANAQKFTVESMKMSLENMTITDGDRDYAQLLKWAEETKAHPKTSNDPKMWYYRGLLFMKIASLNNEVTKKHPDAIHIAYEAFNKAIETDAKNRVSRDAKAYLLNVAIGLYNTGYTAYQNEDFKTAYKDFESALTIMPYDVDGLLKKNNLTAEVLEQMMAFSAMNDGDDAKAITALQALVDKGCLESTVYANLAKLHLKGGDTTAALETITTGREINETDKTLTNLKLDIYLKQGRSAELVSELDEAIDSDPGNVVYYFARAITFEGMGEIEKASADYDKILEIDPEYYDAAFNKGVMYLNSAAKVVESLEGEYKPSIINAKEAEINGYYSKAIVHFENVFENNMDMPIAEKKDLANTMKRIYARLQQMDKYKAMKDFIENN